MSYLFYDLETTGANRAFDQVLTFAGIRTDEDLREIDRYRIRVRLRRDIVPSPKAILAHETDIDHLLAKGTPEARAIRRIHGLMNEPGTLSLGYNTLGFDDEVLRFAFFRNLLPPYTHQWDNNCGRMDLYPMTIVYWLKQSQALKWPDQEETPVLSLKQLNAANGFVDQPLQTAEAHAEAALKLARALSTEEALWHRLKDQFDRNIDRDYLRELPAFTIGPKEYRVGLMVSERFGPENNFQRPVVCLGSHRRYSNQTAWLTLDSAKLRGAASRPITHHARVINRKFGVPHFIFPPSAPSVLRLDDKRRTIARRNTRWLQDHPDVFQQISGYYLEHTHADPPSVDVDAALYPFGFFNDQEMELCEQFHNAAKVSEKLEMLAAFESSVLRELATRIILRNYPPDQWDAGIKRYASWYKRRIKPEHSADMLRDHRGRKRRTPRKVRRQLNKALEHHNGSEKKASKLLQQLEQYTRVGFGAWERSEIND